jgi:hypothetical protein
MDAIKALAGDASEQGKFYPRDDELLLLQKHLRVDHFDVVSSDLDVGGMGTTE